MITMIGVTLASAVGAPARYLLDRAVARRNRTAFPWGTFAINISGSLLLGFLVGMAAHHGLSPTALSVLGGGFCGAYTTFSTFSVETIRLVEEGALGSAVLNALGSVAVGMAAAGAGLGLALVV